jgi:hypothetical protein
MFYTKRIRELSRLLQLDATRLCVLETRVIQLSNQLAETSSLLYENTAILQALREWVIARQEALPGEAPINERRAH